jgi:hypothetical protein
MHALEVTVATRRPRVLLDTNVWSLVTRAHGADELVQLERKHRVDVALQPAALVELMKSSNDDARQADIDTMLRGRRPRLKTEVWAACDEFVDVARQHRPAWLRPRPFRARLAPHEREWSTKNWNDARRNPEALRRRWHQMHEGSAYMQELPELKTDAQAARDQGFDFTAMDAVVVMEGAEGIPDGTVVEPWRSQMLRVLAQQYVDTAQRLLTGLPVDRAKTPYLDWLDPWLKTEEILREPESLNRLVIEELEAVSVPRWWLHGTAEFVQRQWKMVASSGWDAAHMAYLADTDVFLTNDARLVQLGAVLTSSAPTSIGRVARASTTDLMESIGATMGELAS